MVDKILFAVDENGNRIGESHPRAKLCDLDVEVIRLAYGRGWLRQNELAEAFGVSKWAIRDIVYFRRRAHTPDEYVVPKKKRKGHKPPPSRIYNMVEFGVPLEVIKSMEIEVRPRPRL